MDMSDMQDEDAGEESLQFNCLWVASGLMLTTFSNFGVRPLMLYCVFSCYLSRPACKVAWA